MAGLTFTLIRDVEPRLVLRVVAVEKKGGLMGGAEERFRDNWTAEPVNHRACFQCSTPDL